MSRLIDADAFEINLINAIMLMKNMAKAIGLEDDPAIQAEIKAYQDILNGVKEQPTIEPERKPGEWIYDGDCYICTQCKSAFNWWADSQTSNFCPNCGADMRDKEGANNEEPDK